MIESESRGHPSVRLDVERGTEAAVRHLLELGHRRIGHLASAHDRPTFRLRRRAVDRLVREPVPRADRTSPSTPRARRRSSCSASTRS